MRNANAKASCHGSARSLRILEGRGAGERPVGRFRTRNEIRIAPGDVVERGYIADLDDDVLVGIAARQPCRHSGKMLDIRKLFFGVHGREQIADDGADELAVRDNFFAIRDT